MFKFINRLFKKDSAKLRDMENFHEQLKGFKQPGQSAANLKDRGFPAWAALSAGYTIGELKDGGYSARAIKLAGVSKDEVNKVFNK